MTIEELQTVVDLEKVRVIKSALEALDPSVGVVIKDEDHATFRRMVRQWEQSYMDRVSIRKAPRSNGDKP